MLQSRRPGQFDCLAFHAGWILLKARAKTCVCALLCVVSQVALPQSPNQQRDPLALAIVGNAISRLGSTADISKIEDVQLSGTCAMPEGTADVTWTVSGWEFRYEANAQATGLTVLASGHGRPALSESGRIHSIPPLFADAQRPYFAPALILRAELNDPQYSIKSTSSPAASGVEIGKTEGGAISPTSLQRWYFDNTSGLPTRVEYWSPSVTAPAIGTYITLNLSDYQPFDNVLFPTAISTLRGTSTERLCSVGGISINTYPPSSSFDLPLDGGQQ